MEGCICGRRVVVAALVAWLALVGLVSCRYLERGSPPVPSSSPTGVTTAVSPSPGSLVAASSGARLYLPTAGRRYHYRRSSGGGRHEDFFLLAGRAGEGPLLTTLEWTPSEDTYVTHFVAGSDGVYMVADSAPQSRTLWLPAHPRVGVRWESDGSPCHIVKVGEPVEHRGRTYRDCIVVEREVRFDGMAPPVGAVLLQVYAPGVGLLLSRDARTGGLMEQLLEVSEVGDDDAAAEVRRQSVSLDKMR